MTPCTAHVWYTLVNMLVSWKIINMIAGNTILFSQFVAVLLCEEEGCVVYSRCLHLVKHKEIFYLVSVATGHLYRPAKLTEMIAI